MLLTLAIPTYNRSESLHKTLQNFIGQIELYDLQKDVEVVVSDNCSTDNTSEICEHLSASHQSLCLRYFRNLSNIGFDGNVDLVFYHALGKYVWIFSDDDIPAVDALPYIMKLLRKRDVDFGFINYQVSVDGHLLPSRFGKAPDFWLEARDVLKTIHFSNSLISSCIFNRQVWLTAEAKRFLGTLWIHFYVAREILQNGEGLIIGRPLITMVQSGLEESRREKRVDTYYEGVDFYMRAHLKFVEFAYELHHFNYDKETIAQAQALSRREDIYQIINFKLTTPKYSLKQLEDIWCEMMRFRKGELHFFLFVTPLIFVPGWMFKVARLLQRTLKQWLL
jgi:glycosyltransferase involved in cell wall biosynthesis